MRSSFFLVAVLISSLDFLVYRCDADILYPHHHKKKTIYLMDRMLSIPVVVVPVVSSVVISKVRRTLVLVSGIVLLCSSGSSNRSSGTGGGSTSSSSHSFHHCGECLRYVTATTLTAVTTTTRGTNINNNTVLEVYILAGQSNMVGMGSIDHLDQLIQYNNNNSHISSGSSSSSRHRHRHRRTTETDPTTNEYRDTLWNVTTNNYIERNDVYMVYNSNHGKLTVSRTAGYAGGDDKFGPEVLFGWTMVDDDRNNTNSSNNTSTKNRTILLIKVAYGGRDLAIDFRPPSAGMGDYSNVNDPNHYGWEYRIMINDTQHALQNIDTYIPNYNELYNGGYELRGFVWFQGWNDMLSWPKVNEYESNLAHFIHDVRVDLNSTNLPFVIGELGMHGMNPVGKERGRVLTMRSAQRNVCNYTTNTIFVPTAQYAVLNGTTYNGIYHYNGRADTYYHIGRALGLGMRQLLLLMDHNENVESEDVQSEDVQQSFPSNLITSSTARQI